MDPDPDHDWHTHAPGAGTMGGAAAKLIGLGGKAVAAARAGSLWAASCPGSKCVPVMGAGLALGHVVAQVGAPDPGLGTGPGWGWGAVIAALGTSIIVPVINELGTRRRLAEMQRRAETSEAEQAELRRRVSSLEGDNGRLIRDMITLTERNIKLANTAFVLLGRFAEGATSPMPSHPVAAGSKGKLLIVEDDPNAHAPMETYFTEYGYETTISASLAEALEAIERRPDAVIIDLMLKGNRRGGELLLKEIRGRGLPMRAYVTTAKGEDELAEIKSLGPDGLFRKPIVDPGILLSLMERDIAVDRAKGAANGTGEGAATKGGP